MLEEIRKVASPHVTNALHLDESRKLNLVISESSDELSYIIQEQINNEIYSCIVVKTGKILHSKSGRGIKPLLSLYEENIEDLKDSFVADKVIGKAAAIFLINAKVKEVYAYLISKPGLDLLLKNDIKVEYKELTNNIINHEKTDLCPMEKAVLDCDDIEEGIINIKETVNSLMQKK